MMMPREQQLLLLLSSMAISVTNAQERPLAQCNPDKILTILITTDEWPEDTTWRLKNEQNTTFHSMPTSYASGYTTPKYDEKYTTYMVCLYLCRQIYMHFGVNLIVLIFSTVVILLHNTTTTGFRLSLAIAIFTVLLF